jgi:hypothetical protein
MMDTRDLDHLRRAKHRDVDAEVNFASAELVRAHRTRVCCAIYRHLVSECLNLPISCMLGMQALAA